MELAGVIGLWPVNYVLIVREKRDIQRFGGVGSSPKSKVRQDRQEYRGEAATVVMLKYNDFISGGLQLVQPVLHSWSCT